MKALIALTTSVRSWQDGMEKRWKQLPVEESRRIVLYFFTCYVCITLAVLVQVVYQVSTNSNTIKIDHIINPVVVNVIKEKQKPNTDNNERE